MRTVSSQAREKLRSQIVGLRHNACPHAGADVSRWSRRPTNVRRDQKADQKKWTTAGEAVGFLGAEVFSFSVAIFVQALRVRGLFPTQPFDTWPTVQRPKPMGPIRTLVNACWTSALERRGPTASRRWRSPRMARRASRCRSIRAAAVLGREAERAGEAVSGENHKHERRRCGREPIPVLLAVCGHEQRQCLEVVARRGEGPVDRAVGRIYRPM